MATDCGCEMRNNVQQMTESLEEIAQWLREQFDRTGKSKSALAEKLGKDKSVVTRMLKAERWPQYGETELIREFFGLPRSNSLMDDTKTPDDHGFAKGHDYEGRLPGAIPEADARGGLGQGQVGESRVVSIDRGEAVIGHRVVSEWVLPQDYLRYELHTSPQRTMMLEVIGDSMFPTLQSGDRVVVDYGHTRPIPDGLYVIDEGHGPMVKRLQLVRRTDPAEVEIISDNQNHRPYRLTEGEFQVLGRVCARITRM
jgi:hypothetical protein